MNGTTWNEKLIYNKEATSMVRMEEKATVKRRDLKHKRKHSKINSRGKFEEESYKCIYTECTLTSQGKGKG